MAQNEDVLADLKTTDWFNTIADQRDLADTLRTFVKEDDTIFIWGNHIGPYYFLKKTPPTLITTSVMAISPWAPTQWKDQILQELRSSTPNYMLIEHYDYVDVITGFRSDSYRGMLQWNALHEFIRENYDSLTTSHSFSIYQQKHR